MALYNIPIDTDIKYQEKKLTLGGELFTFRFAFNQRASTWYIDIITSENETVVLNKPLVPNADILKFLDPNIAPPGFLFIISTVGRTIEMNGNNFGTEFLLIYADAEA